MKEKPKSIVYSNSVLSIFLSLTPLAYSLCLANGLSPFEGCAKAMQVFAALVFFCATTNVAFSIFLSKNEDKRNIHAWLHYSEEMSDIFSGKKLTKKKRFALCRVFFFGFLVSAIVALLASKNHACHEGLESKIYISFFFVSLSFVFINYFHVVVVFFLKKSKG